MNALKGTLMAAMLVLTSWAWAETSPVPMLESSADQIIQTLKKNKAQLKQNHQIIYQAIRQYLLPNVDVSGMARSVLGREIWNRISLAEKKEFTDAFTQLVIRTYASPLAEYSDERIRFLPMRAPTDGRFARVNSVIIRSSGPDIPLSYHLVSKQGQWKIYDLHVEGVSLLQSFRSQFGQALKNAPIREVIAQMRHNKKAA